MATLKNWLTTNEFNLPQNDVQFIEAFFGTMDQVGITVESDGPQEFFVMPGVVVSNNPTGTRIDRDSTFGVRSWPTQVEVREVASGIGADGPYLAIANAQDNDDTRVLFID